MTTSAARTPTKVMTTSILPTSTRTIRSSAPQTSTKDLTTPIPHTSAAAMTTPILQTSTKAITTPIEPISTQPSPTLPPTQSEYRALEREYSHHAPLLFSVFISNDHAHSKHLVAVRSTGVPKKSRCVDQLLPPAAVQWFSLDDRSMDNHPVHTDLLIGCSATTFHSRDNTE